MNETEKYEELPSTVGKTPRVTFPDGTTMDWEVVEEIRRNEDKEKILILQRLRSKGGRNSEMFRFGYYIIGKKPKMAGKWTWGQFAPFITLADFAAMINEAKDRKWIE